MRACARTPGTAPALGRCLGGPAARRAPPRSRRRAAGGSICGSAKPSQTWPICWLVLVAIVRQHVDDQQAAAGPEHARRFGQRAGRIGHVVQHQREQRRRRAAVVDRQRFERRPAHLDVVGTTSPRRAACSMSAEPSTATTRRTSGATARDSARCRSRGRPTTSRDRAAPAAPWQGGTPPNSSARRRSHCRRAGEERLATSARRGSSTPARRRRRPPRRRAPATCSRITGHSRFAESGRAPRRPRYRARLVPRAARSPSRRPPAS